MSMSSHALCDTLEIHLGTLGYKLFGSAHEGWEWELGGYTSSPFSDSRQEAAAAALDDLVKRTAELLEAAVKVITTADGDRSAAIQELMNCVNAIRVPEIDPGPCPAR